MIVDMFFLRYLVAKGEIVAGDETGMKGRAAPQDRFARRPSFAVVEASATQKPVFSSSTAFPPLPLRLCGDSAGLDIDS
ncbi:hypothetical protein [Noviherbaspirillum sp. UKPF54]|uniref:hypothetical protein n=1 Tax=Noviherbaspirillum sp. UKPF54 TaxID=2601898 RepID=UPI0011B1278D|nr:hypothetical protein [Noviherbaspirillum sp. UKPF54]QDZ28542.1 hypothetical protein FAY22_11635 [Noviherbaspirillum sp. UKPF54]